MTIKILHLADLHLDHAYLRGDSVPGYSRARRAGLRQALQRALKLAVEEHVDAVTIAGDLFESDHLSLDTVQFVLEQFRSLDPIQVFIAPGNQDPVTSDSHYALMEWTRNVHIFRQPQLSPLTLRDDWLIWGFGYPRRDFAEPVLADFVLPTDKPSILLMHGAASDLAWSPGKEPAVPFTFDAVRNAGFRLALLGHRHESYYADAGNLPICYAGSAEPLSFGEPSGHHVWLAEWEAGHWHLESIDVSQWRCHTWQFDVSGYASPAQVKAHVRGLWNEAQDGHQAVGSVLLLGTADPDAAVTIADVVRELESEIPALRIEDRTELAVRHDDATNELTIRGSLVRRLGGQSPDDEATRRLHRAALQFGLKALQGQRVIL